MTDNRSKYELYSAALKRLLMWHVMAKKLKLILLTEFPKSGGSWFGQMFSDAVDIPFPRNNTPSLKQSILHGHHLFHPRMGKAICVMRDGRDVMVSAYFHFLFKNSHNREDGVAYHRSKMPFKDYDNIERNLPEFIKYIFEVYPHKNRFHFSWSDMVNNAIRYKEKICIIKYEDLLIDPVKELEKTISFYNLPKQSKENLENIVEKYSFKNITNRKPGEEDRKNFVRKGISGDWKNHFNNEACIVFKKYAGNELIKMNYEVDMNWGNSIKKDNLH